MAPVIAKNYTRTVNTIGKKAMHGAGNLWRPWVSVRSGTCQAPHEGASPFTGSAWSCRLRPLSGLGTVDRASQILLCLPWEPFSRAGAPGPSHATFPPYPAPIALCFPPSYPPAFWGAAPLVGDELVPPLARCVHECKISSDCSGVLWSTALSSISCLNWLM